MSPITYPFDAPIDYGRPVAAHPLISLLRLPIPDNLKYINTYLLHDGEDSYIYDTGMATAENKAFWQSLIDSGKYQFKGILISHHHPDHFGLANWLQKQLDIPVYMDNEELETIKKVIADTTVPQMPEHFQQFFSQFDMSAQQVAGYFQLMQGVNLLHSGLPENIKAIEDCPLLANGWQLIKGHGHSPSVCCLYHADEKLFLSADQVLPEISSIVYASWTREQINPLKSWLQSNTELKTLIPDDVTVYPSHKHIFKGLHTRLQQIIELHQHRLTVVNKLLDELDYTQVNAITRALFERELKILPDLFMASGETLAHIEYILAEQGKTL